MSSVASVRIAFWFLRHRFFDFFESVSFLSLFLKINSWSQILLLNKMCCSSTAIFSIFFVRSVAKNRRFQIRLVFNAIFANKKIKHSKSKLRLKKNNRRYFFAPKKRHRLFSARFFFAQLTIHVSPLFSIVFIAQTIRIQLFYGKKARSPCYQRKTTQTPIFPRFPRQPLV